MDSVQSQTIKWLRFPLIVLIVFIHRTTNYDLGPSVNSLNVNFFNLSSTDLFVLIKIFCQHVFPRVAVPSFFLISGYLFYTNVKRWSIRIYYHKMRSRLNTLFLPYLLWNLIAISYPLSLCIFRDVPMPNTTAGWLSFFWDTGDGLAQPLDYPLWYVRDLMVMVLLTPLSWYFIKFINGIFLVPLAIFYVMGFWPQIAGLNIISVFFFNFGAFLAISDKPLEFHRIEIPNYILTCLLALLTVYNYGKCNFSYLLALYSISGVISVFNIAGRMVRLGVFTFSFQLKRYVFFIYAAHTLVLVFILDILMYDLFQNANMLLQLCIYMLMPFVKIAFCILLYRLLEQSMPSVLRILVGGSLS